MRPGELYMADLPPAGPHPVIVVSRESLNRGDYALIVVCTSSRFGVRSQLPNCVPFLAGQFGLSVDCVAQCENVLSLDKSTINLDAGPIGRLSDSAFRDVVRAIGYVIDADCEPQ